MDLPIASITRSKHEECKECHALDDSFEKVVTKKSQQKV